MKTIGVFMIAMTVVVSGQVGRAQGIVYEGKEGAGKGKHIVLISGDEEYRSEEGLPMLGKILAVRHGFKCTVLFAVNPTTGDIEPNEQVNIPGLKALESADVMFMLLRFREPADDQMKYIADFVESGKPIIGLRTSTHAFAYGRNKQSPYAKYDWGKGGGFGQKILGDTWISHHGGHGSQSARGIINPEYKDHPVLKGVTDIWGPSDVYGIKNLKPTDQVLVHGQVIAGMKPTDPPVVGKQNEPMMPLVWIREGDTWLGDAASAAGKKRRALCTTMGASVDLESEGLRRLLVNACYWAVGLENKIPANANVDYVGEYKPTFFGFGKGKKGVKPSDHELK